MQRHFQDIRDQPASAGALSHYELVGQHWLGQNIDLTRP